MRKPLDDPVEISRRLKAARWLAGGVDDRGRPVPLSPQELAEREPLRRNRITANAIMEIEQLKKQARPMELREIARALGLPEAWFSAEQLVGGPTLRVIERTSQHDDQLRYAAELMAPRLLEAARALARAQGREQQERDAPDRPAGSAAADSG